MESRSREKEIEAILAIVVGFAFFGLIAHKPLLLKFALGVGAVGLFSKWGTSKIVFLWMKLSEGMGYVMSKAILGIVFFVFLFPVALISRLFKKTDSLMLKKPVGSSFYYTRNHTYTKEDLKNIW